MLRRLLCSASLSSLLLLGVISVTSSSSLLAQTGQQSEAKESVTGKVTSIGSDSKSFSMEVDGAGNKRTLQFVVNEATQIQGQVRVGTSATVEYQPSADGTNMALSVTPQTSQTPQY